MRVTRYGYSGAVCVHCQRIHKLVFERATERTCVGCSLAIHGADGIGFVTQNSVAGSLCEVEIVYADEKYKSFCVCFRRAAPTGEREDKCLQCY